MSSGFEQLVSALETRYDFQSARTLAREALKSAGLKEQAKYSKAELGQFADQLSTIGSSLDAVWDKLGVAPAGAPAPAAKKKADDNKPEGNKAPAKKADDKKADDKKAPAKKADDKKADDKKADDKK